MDILSCLEKDWSVWLVFLSILVGAFLYFYVLKRVSIDKLRDILGIIISSGFVFVFAYFIYRFFETEKFDIADAYLFVSATATLVALFSVYLHSQKEK